MRRSEGIARQWSTMKASTLFFSIINPKKYKTMETIKSSVLTPVAMTTGKSMTFSDGKEMYYASRRVANEILAAKMSKKTIEVWVQKPELRVGEQTPLKPYQRLNWLATPSRF